MTGLYWLWCGGRVMSRMSRAQVAVGLWRAQAKRWQAQATRLQADNTRLQARVAELEDKVERLTEQVARLGRVAFGGSSQKQAVAPLCVNLM